MKDVSKYNEVEFTDDGLILRKAYGVGKGHSISKTELDKLSFQKAREHKSGCFIIEPFTVPSQSEGHIKKVARNNCIEQNSASESVCPEISEENNNISQLFYCPEVGCVKKFSTYKGLENHVLFGKHLLQLEKKSTYDKIKEQWASLCNDVVITCKNLSLSTERIEAGLNVEPMGWALKKSKRLQRFSEKVKSFLYEKFIDGEKSGKKCNPVEVSEEMKLLRGEDGKRVFTVDEWLTALQITSFFSRLAIKRPEVKKSLKEEEINDDDLEAALSALDEQALMDNLCD